MKLQNSERTKILIVDDKPENHIALEAIFEDDHYTFKKAYSGRTALKILLNEFDFALILMDVRMPGMNGFETASMIYKREKLAHIPIIFITANDYDEQNLFESYKSGGIDYIVKPINPEILKMKVRALIELYNKNQQLLAHKQKLNKSNLELKRQIEEKFKIENKLKLKNIQLSEAQKLTHIGSWEWNLLTNRITGSDEIYKIYELDKVTDFSIDDLFEKIHPEDSAQVQAAIADSISFKRPFDVYFRYLITNGSVKFINKRGRIITNEDNEAVKIFGTSQDISNLRKMEEQAKIFKLFEKMLNEIYIFSEKDLNFLYANAEGLRNLGSTKDGIKSLNLFDVLLKHDKNSFEKLVLPLKREKKEKIVFFGNFQRRDKTSYPVEVHLQLVKHDQKREPFPPLAENVFFAVVLNLIDRKRTEQVLAESLKEKEILIKEIHHRVKNNLQVISSLLQLQKSFIDNEEIISVIDESCSRVRSMGLLHERLYNTKDFKNIDFQSYISELASSLIEAYRGLNKQIELEVNSKVDKVNVDMGIALGLIVNEFISNSLKHGFKELTDGKISICFEQIENNALQLSVKDNGKGLPTNFDIENSDTLGLQLVKSLVEQIEGKLSINNGSGTEFRITFPV